MAHDEFDDFFGEEEAKDAFDTKADGRLLRVPLSRISPNLVNPRTDFGTREELEDFGRSLRRRQVHAIPVVTRKAYLGLWPEHEDTIGNVDVVIVSGERRFRGATAVELPALECVINDAVAASRKTFLDAVVSENIDRQNFDAIEEATAVEALVQAFGTAGAVAKHYERGDAWVSQRRILLRLAPEVQALVRRRDMPLEPARKLGKLVKDNDWSAAEQSAWWEHEQANRSQAAAEKKAAKAARKTQPPAEQRLVAPTVAPSAPGPVFTAVKTEQDTPGASAPIPDRFTAVDQTPTETTIPEVPARPGESLPEPRQAPPALESADSAGPRVNLKMPWHDGVACAELVFRKMASSERLRLIKQLLEYEKQEQSASREVLAQ